MGEKFHVLVADSVQFGCERNGECSDRALSMLDGLQKESNFEVDAGKIPGCHTLLKVAGDYDAVILWDDEGWQLDMQLIWEKYPEIRVIVISSDLNGMYKVILLNFLMVSQEGDVCKIIKYVKGKMRGGIVI